MRQAIPTGGDRSSKHSPHSSKLQQTRRPRSTDPANSSKLCGMVTVTTVTLHNRRSDGGVSNAYRDLPTTTLPTESFRARIWRFFDGCQAIRTNASKYGQTSSKYSKYSKDRR